ncbi:hypothetical protein [Cesiribacter sp. SM1]|uniref:hypothetical protein n=1 Tax=Cesiribacter sp. SM1 TaxID=2861196 RepID=UPI001CD19B63|nr:hypothetical protein [Cesiribacter sp. SM1]
MDPSAIFFYSLCLLAVFFIIRYPFINKKEKEEEDKIKERLKDEAIYDPVTGARMSLEEAESGLYIANDNLERIKPDDELEKYYNVQEVEYEKIKNYIIKEGMEPVEEEVANHLIERVISKSTVIDKYDEITISYTFRPALDFYVSLALVEYTITTGKYIDHAAEWQIIGASVNEAMTVDCSGQYRTIQSLRTLLESIAIDYSIEQIEASLFFKYNKPATLGDFQELINKIKKHKLTIE